MENAIPVIAEKIYYLLNQNNIFKSWKIKKINVPYYLNYKVNLWPISWNSFYATHNFFDEAEVISHSSITITDYMYLVKLQFPHANVFQILAMSLVNM